MVHPKVKIPSSVKPSKMEQLNYKQIKKETKVNTACRSNPISEGLKASLNPVISEDLTFLTTHNLKGCGGNDTQFSV